VEPNGFFMVKKFSEKLWEADMNKVFSNQYVIRLELDKKDLAKIVEPIVKKADQFGKATLDMAYLLAEQDYRMDDNFRQPKNVFN
jgi:hypothetical protein